MFDESDLEHMKRKIDLFFEKSRNDTKGLDLVTQKLVIKTTMNELLWKAIEMNKDYKKSLSKAEEKKVLSQEKKLKEFSENYLSERLEELW